MSVEDQTPPAVSAQILQEAREGVRSLQFFVAAMAAQLRDLHDRLEAAEAQAVSSGQASGADGLRVERDASHAQTEELQRQLDDAQRRSASLQLELDRRNVTFADHQAARQEIARLRDELASAQVQEPPDRPNDTPNSRRRPFGLG
ncbi:MAG: hypothetical protein ACR2GA_04490 [Chloroflexota bacterium]